MVVSLSSCQNLGDYLDNVLTTAVEPDLKWYTSQRSCYLSVPARSVLSAVPCASVITLSDQRSLPRYLHDYHYIPGLDLGTNVNGLDLQSYLA